MDRREEYRNAVTELVRRYASYKPSYGDYRSEAVIDREGDNYEVLQYGWEGQKRVHGSIIHIAIRDGKVWIEYNGTDRLLGKELMEAGVAREDIVIGFLPADVRHLAGYASG